jgi:Uma2 family endonuclease
MSTQTTDYLDAIQHLPAGGTLILTEVSWEEYEQLLSSLGDSTSLRVSYDQGRMEIMSPSHRHDYYKEVVSRLASEIADQMNLDLENFGSSTYKQEWLARGVEPDVCFYVQNAPRIIGNLEIDLRTDPPPDVVVEIDISHSSKAKLPIYAGMKVPELWVYDEKHARMYQLVGDQYTQIPASIAFPLLTRDVLTRFLEQSKSEGQTATTKAFREWLHPLLNEH